jgi:hypothetical protein
MCGLRAQSYELIIRLNDQSETTWNDESLRNIYFIDDEDLLYIYNEICNYAKNIGRIMSFNKAYGYPNDSHPKLGTPYNINFIMEEFNIDI